MRSLQVQAQAELERRRRRRQKDTPQRLATLKAARDHLTDFTRFTYPGYRAEEFHYHLGHALTAVVEGKIKRLMVSAPPQHGKSELVSVRMPAFWLAHRPNDPVMLTSYSSNLAETHGRHARNVVESIEFKELFPEVQTDDASRAVNLWRMAYPHRGFMLSTGVGGPITGHGALLGIVDDPFENWQQAYSETYRRRVVEWYKSTFRTRIWEDGAIVIVATRWHPLDLIGVLLLEQGSEWTVLRYPAAAETRNERKENNRFLGIQGDFYEDLLGREPGQPLCPERFSAPTLQELERDVGPLAWQAEYQQVPRSAEGGTFLRDWFMEDKLVTSELIPPYEHMTLCRFWDIAATEASSSSDPDYTCGTLVGMTRDGNYYVLDVRRFRKQAAAIEREMYETALGDGHRVAIRIEQEPGAAGKIVIDHYVSDVLVGFAVEGVRATGSKEVRAQPCTGPASTGRVYLRKAAWNQLWIDEVCTFPMGAHDDVVDSWAGAMNYLMEKRRRAVMPLTTMVLPGRMMSRDMVGPGQKLIGTLRNNRRT